MIAWQLEHGADVNVRDAFDRTPLHFALMPASHVYGWKQGFVADPLGGDEPKENPRMAAAREITMATLKRLIDGGADLNARDNRGNTPLHYLAVSSGWDNPSPLISECGDDDYGVYYVPSYINTVGGDISLILREHLVKLRKFLEKRGANANPTNDRGETPVQLTARTWREYYGKRIEREEDAEPEAETEESE
ncbi:MAG TPA: hypothetical protein HPP83_07270 [Candidatus Hydrogenedentes bacterium]|nr:hypothetical protein [Candidatus Hydrogenedentota bacterium]